MATLYLHVGHSKTGTSWLQAALRENPRALAANGLAYPILQDIGTEQGAEIGQGNGLALAVSLENFRAGLNLIDRSACPQGAVLSSEEFFPRLSMSDDPSILPRVARASGFERIQMLLFIRDPVAHAVSLWQQYLKRGGGTAPIEKFFASYRVPERVALFLDRFASLPGVGLTCLNYGRHRRELLRALEAWLGLPGAALSPPRARVINRGMTRAELSLQLALNRHVGRAGRLLSDALCVGLPELSPDLVRPDAAIQEAMCERLARALERVNRHLPESERYRCDIAPAPAISSGGTLGFSPEQIEVIGAALGGEIRRLRMAVADLRDASHSRGGEA